MHCDYQLSEARQRFGDQDSTLNLCCHRQLALFLVATCRPLTSLAAKCMKLQAMILLPSEMRKVAGGNTVILNPKLLHQSFVVPYSTDNHSNKTEPILHVIGLCFWKVSVLLIYFDCAYKEHFLQLKMLHPHQKKRVSYYTCCPLTTSSPQLPLHCGEVRLYTNSWCQ